jgi:MOSC domain-containing protein YiiM
MTVSMSGSVVSVHSDDQHRFSKPAVHEINLLAGLGVEGDAHAGVTVQHLSRVRTDPSQPNLRQVHLIQAELFDQLQDNGFTVRPGELGENIATRGLDLLTFPTGTILRIGAQAVLEVTGLRNPCQQINGYQDGLLKQVVNTDDDGTVVRRAGVMGIVLQSGPIRAGDSVSVRLPDPPHIPLERV